ncbi:unannotated protein [freshwater metagenome]|uniref:Unannotated protein n=1 Tax=freshwater metagenome TaxID=449393 RepID=A0A6J7FMN9_9ZZZZ
MASKVKNRAVVAKSVPRSLQPGPWIRPRSDTGVTAAALNKVVLVGSYASADITDRVTSAPITATRTGAAVLTLEVSDPERTLVSAGRLFDREDDLLLDDNIDVEVGGIWWRLMGLQPSDTGWTIALEDRLGAWLRRNTRPMRAVRGRVNRAAFIWRMYDRTGGGSDLFVPELFDAQREAKSSRPTTSTDSSATSSAARSTGRGWPASKRPTVKGVRADDTQIRAIVDILTECARLNCSRRVTIATIMCATQESVMRPLNHGDTAGPDSRGFFQQRAPWGPESVRRTATGSCRMFLTGGRGGQAGWKQKHGSLRNGAGNLDRMITAVQVSVGGYYRWEDEATKTVDAWLKAGGQGGASESSSRSTTTSETREIAYEFELGQDGKKEDALTCANRLAGEVGWRHWVFANAGVYASDGELATAAVGLRIRREHPAVLRGPDWKWEVRHTAQEATAEIIADRLPEPGQVATIESEGPGSGRWLISSVTSDLARPIDIGRGRMALRCTVSLARPQSRKLEPANETKTTTTTTSSSAEPGGGQSARGAAGDITTTGGAKGIVDQAARLAARAGGSRVYVGSSFRGGSTTTSGNRSDHASNDSGQAARDIGVRGIDLLYGPPSSSLDAGVAALGRAFGRDYGTGKRKIVDTFQWRGYRVQIIWRTPEYGGHMGHIHVGVRKN